MRNKYQSGMFSIFQVENGSLRIGVGCYSVRLTLKNIQKDLSLDINAIDGFLYETYKNFYKIK